MRLLLPLLATLLLGFSNSARADDCTLREPARSDPNWKCKKASSYQGCVPSADFQRWGCLELDADAKLCADDGAFNLTVYLAHSHVTLDGNGQVIDHAGPDKKRRQGVRTPYSRSVEGITLRDITFRNTGRYAIDLKRFFRGEQLAGDMSGHRDIRIERVGIENVEQWGIYVGQNSRGIRIDDVHIDRAYGGIYLEAGSRSTLIRNARITNSTDREAVAVDSSSHNVIEGSYFAGNGNAINIYKNCGENWGQVCPIPRAMDASDTTIRACTFDGDDLNVAWRQYKLYGIGFCSEVGLVGYWRDQAARTLVDSNLFVDAVLDIDDGPFVVINNRFRERSELALGSIRPPLYLAPPVALPGLIVFNAFEDASTLNYVTRGVYDRLYVINNVDAEGHCLPGNRCMHSSRYTQVALRRAAGIPQRGTPTVVARDGTPAPNLAEAPLLPTLRARPPRPRYRRGVHLPHSRHTPHLCTGCR